MVRRDICVCRTLFERHMTAGLAELKRQLTTFRLRGEGITTSDRSRIGWMLFGAMRASMSVSFIKAVEV